MKQAYIVDGLRSPIGSFGGSLSGIRADDLAAKVLAGLLGRHPNLDPAAIGDVIMGCANQSGEDNRNVARMALLLAGIPHSVPGETVNRLCASGLSASMAAARCIQLGESEVMLAGGVEHMTRSPWVLSKSAQPFGRDSQLFDSSFGWRFVNPEMKARFGVDAMGETAENLAERYDISRADQDAFALWSQMKAAKAQQNGLLGAEIMPIRIPQRKGNELVVDKDEFIKPNTTLEVLQALKPAFRNPGTVTAGNASGLNDGAAALLLAGETALKTHNLKPMARFAGVGYAGVEPKYMGIGPVEATRKALAHAGLTLEQMDHIEINEAFAAQVLACTRQWGISDTDPRLNPNGGAIALGHPLGMSGARILLSAARGLQASQGRYALVTMCIGVGQGYAVVIERTE